VRRLLGIIAQYELDVEE